ncbi:sulfurtransferase [Metabacillus fastidiosus]|uniref:sulfurtransferase n=1 Tax=Metabacillus fastidiosus TaxID=1458 RepID=UPI003D2B9706
MSNLITLEEAFQKLKLGKTVFIDTRFVFGRPELGYEGYLQEHIPSAVYFHLDKDLSGPILTHGGRHPIPSKEEFARKLGEAGIDNDTHVIVYDNEAGNVAARCWWLLKYFGHKHVQMLNRPLSHWKEAGYPITNEIPSPDVKKYIAIPNELLTVSMENVRAHLHDKGRVLIDARKKKVYTGEENTKYPKIGHIPGALNYFWEVVLSKEGVFQEGEQQLKTFQAIPKEKEIIVYCGAGVTACPNILALTEAGYENVKLYVGSWGDWTSYENNLTECGESSL